MALVYFDRKPTLRYNFDTSAPLKGERHSHRMQVNSSRPMIKSLILETIRCKDEQLVKLNEVFS